jgi:hypothetical protein
VRDLKAAGIDFTDDFAASPEAVKDLGYDALGMLQAAVKHTIFRSRVSPYGGGRSRYRLM